MIFIGVIVSVDLVLLVGVLTVYEGGRTNATLVINKENPSDEIGVSYESKKQPAQLPEAGMRVWLGVWI